MRKKRVIWTPAMDKFLKKNYARMTAKQFASHFGIDYRCVEWRAIKKLGLRKPQKWSPAMDRFLMKNYQSMTAKEIAKELGVSYRSVEFRARTVLGLRKVKQYSEKEIVKLYRKGWSFTKIGKKVGLSHKSVSRILNELGEVIRECVDCGISLEGSRADRLRCTECMRIYRNTVIMPKTKARPEYKEWRDKYDKEYRSKPENKKRKKKWHKDNEESVNKSREKYKKNNPEKVKLQKRRYNVSPKGKKAQAKYDKTEKGRLNNHYQKQKRRAKERDLITKFTKEEWFKLAESTKGICPCCKKKRKMTLDHILAVARAPVGFTYTIKDIQPLCQRCNNTKNTRIVKFKISQSSVPVVLPYKPKGVRLQKGDGSLPIILS